MSFIEELEKTLRDRRKKLPENSYTATLFRGEPNQLLKKITEEAGEAVLALRDEIDQSDGNREERRKLAVEESADLVFHLLLGLVRSDIAWEDVEAELRRRHGK